MKLQQVFDMLTNSSHHNPPETYQEELNRQSGPLVIPLIVIFIFGWLPYIALDIAMFPQLEEIVSLRLGTTTVAVLILILRFIPYFRNKSYHLILTMILYVELATGLIVGLTAGNPSYMGGISLLIILLPLIPFRKKHSLVILGACCIAFCIAGIYSKMQFKTPVELYGLFNLIAALLLAVTAIFLLDSIRRENYENHRSIHNAHIDLREASQKLVIKNDELKKAYTQLETTNEELKEANKVRRDLLGMAAHDLKDPLQVISLYTETLKTELEDNAPAVKKLDRISRSADKMINLIQEILETATIDDGKLKLNKSTVDMNRLVKSVIKSNTGLASNKGQLIHLESRENCLVNGDRMRLQQVLDNLISNAVKFSPTGKSIWVSVESVDGTVLVKVRDEGPGISEEDKLSLFKKFQRLSARPTAGESSTGLGLYIARNLAKFHDGDIHIESKRGCGATFIVQLPAVEDEKNQKKAEQIILTPGLYQ